ncbi:MAG: hypothetical protein LBU88_08800 [Treponema sp.]|jgi:hypothetical protein|nr:hypothetical protein [Treponema sp.]
MLRLPINWFAIVNFILLCTLLAACGFIDLRSINYTVNLQGFESILNEYNSPLTIEFDTQVVKKDAEGVFQVSSDSGSVKGDFNWQGNSLYFVPVSGWTAGIRYTLNINGTIRALDGRELRLQHFASFYAINKNPRPLLEYFYPDNEQSIGTNNFALELQFTISMDRLSVESALSLDGIGNKTFEWQDDDKNIKVAADKPLSAWTSYRWNLKDSAKSIDGVPLPKQYSGSFTTDLDITLPEITEVYPVTFSYGSWNATGANIETGLALGEAIAVEFNKPMGESVLRSLRFEPSLTGRAEMLAENKVVFIFTRNPEPETLYTLIISQDARDAEGLKIGSEYRISFLPDIPYLKVLSFVDSGVNTAGEITFSIGFSLPLNNEEKLNAAQKILLSPFFPGMLPPIALQFVSWVSDDRIFMRWEGLQTGIKDAENYYKLTIPGGRGGISAGGLYMKENIEIFLEAVNEN